MNKCPLCRQKKAKRYCPSLSREICPTCCGRERVRSLPCDPGCPYGEQAKERQFTRRMSRIQGLDPRLTEKVVNEFPWMFQIFLELLADFHLSFPSAENRQVREALDSVKKSVETEIRGIIYEPTLPDPSRQSLIRSFRETIRRIRQQVKNEYSGEYYRLEDILDCLRFLDLYMQTVIQEDTDPLHFLKSTVLMSETRGEKKESSSSRIIVP